MEGLLSTGPTPSSLYEHRIPGCFVMSLFLRRQKGPGCCPIYRVLREHKVPGSCRMLVDYVKIRFFAVF